VLTISLFTLRNSSIRIYVVLRISKTFPLMHINAF